MKSLNLESLTISPPEENKSFMEGKQKNIYIEEKSYFKVVSIIIANEE